MTSQVSCQTGVNLGSRAPGRGPRTVLIRRENGGFGFTLRHFIVYPPDSIKKQSSGDPSLSSYSGDPPWQNSSNPSDSMDTIFVREVREGSCAQLAGLVTGDRIITINKQPLTGKTYRQVIDLIQNSGNTLHLLVVPKEDDILQKYFSGSAYQPVDRCTSQSEAQSSAGGRQRSSVSSVPGSEPIYAHVVRKRTLSHQDSPLDRSWPLRQSSSSYQCVGSSYPGNCRSLNCLPNESSHIPPNTSSRPPSFGYCNRSSISETDASYHSPRSSIALDHSRSHHLYSSHSQDGEPIYATTRPYRFQETFSKLLVDMWGPHSKGLQHPSSSSPSAHISRQENVYRMRDQNKPGLAGFFTKTMKAFLPPHENIRSPDHQWSESNNGYYGKQTKTDYLNACRETDILDSDTATDSPEVPGSVRLVAHRRQLFESSSLQDRAQERTNMYRHEFSRVSSPNPCPIVQKRAAQFENLASPTHTDSRSPSSSRTKEEKIDNGFHSEGNNLAFTGKGSNSPSSGYHFKPVTESPPSSTSVTYRRKHFTDQESDKHIARRISYLKATAGERMLVESDLSEDDEKRANAHRSQTQSEGNEQRIEKAKSFYVDKSPRSCDSDDLNHQHHLPGAVGSEEEDEVYEDDVLSPTSDVQESRVRRNNVRTEPRLPPPMMESWLSCKLVSVQGKRSTDRSWKTVWALFRGSTLHLLRDKKEPSTSPMENGSEIYDTCINLKTTYATIADDYTKRKHVLRLRLANGTEYLFQADSKVSMVEWLCTLKAAGLENEKEFLWHHASVLEKAAAYEQQISLNSQSNNVSPNREGSGLVSPSQGGKALAGVKLPFRHRSPTGHSPAVKTRRASHGDELSQAPRLSSVLRGRVGGGWRKTHSLQTEVLPKGASVGVRLEDCPPSLWNQYVPLLVDLCVQIVETYGLEMVGIFRVPGNNAAVSLLIDAVNQGALLPALSAPSSSSAINFLQDPRWKDVNVVSSLLKAFFRKLPEPLLTTALYSKFINASKMEDVNKRLMLLRALLHQLPRHHFETLKFLIQHLKKVVDYSHINKMESRNLAIVFGPTLVRPSDTSMIALVTDMSHQCYIIETLINYVDWLFNKHSLEELPVEMTAASRRMSHPLPISRSDLLLQNLHKLEQSAFSPSASNSSSPTMSASIGKPGQEVVPRELLSSLMFVSHRKHSNRRRDQPLSTVPPTLASSPSPSSPADSTGTPQCSSDPCSPYKKNSLSSEPSRTSSSPSPLTSSTFQRRISKDLDTQDTGSLGDEVVHHTYDEVNSRTQERIRRFERETKALLRREQPPPSPSIGGSGTSSLPSSSPGGNKGSEGECRIDWQQIEQEWQKAKRELEQDDLLDVVADDPSFLNYLLNRQDHSPPNATTNSRGEYSSAPASLNLTPQAAQLENLSNSLEGTLQLGNGGGSSSTTMSANNRLSSSPTTSAKSHRNSLQSTSTQGPMTGTKSRGPEPLDKKSIWKTQASPAPSSSSSTSSSHISSSEANHSAGNSATTETNPTVFSENGPESGARPMSSGTNYNWHFTPFSKIS